MSSIAGLVILCSTINFAVWFVFGMPDFSFIECLKYALGTEAFLLGLVSGIYLMLGGV